MTNPGDLDPAQIIASGYDIIAERYRSWSGSELAGRRNWTVQLLDDRLPDGAPVLELGCATGIPVALALARRHELTGVDLSPRQIALARQNVPTATFLCGDMTEIEFPDCSFDAVIALYAVNHIPRGRHGHLFRSVARWLRPAGLFVASSPTGDDPGTVEPDWLGVPMYFSGYDAHRELALIEEAGLVVERAEIEDEDEDGIAVPFLWVLARSAR